MWVYKDGAGTVITNAVIPNQLWMACATDRTPRFVLGREALYLQGLPLELLQREEMEKFPESLKLFIR